MSSPVSSSNKAGMAQAESAAPLAEALTSGRAAVLPIEGGFVACARADGDGGGGTGSAARMLVSRLGALAPWSPGEFWLAPSPAACEAAMGADAPGVHRRLVRRLTPGPATFVAGAGTDGFRSEPGGGSVFRAAMCTGGPAALAVLGRVAFPVVASEVLGADRRPVDDLESALAAVRALAGEGPVVSGPEPGARPVGRTPPTVIELVGPPVAAGGRGGEGGAGPGDPAGRGYAILRAGAYEDRFIRKQLGLTVLFVCTGNTCRSPMAEAIANWLVGRSGAGAGGAAGGGGEVRFVSAGTAAAGGSGATPEGITALRELGIGVGAGGGIVAHRSRPLTRKIVEEADVIYTMGRSHLHAVLELAPDAEGRVRTLDPDGGDVPDPIGMSPEVYVSTARRIVDMVRRRLKELGL